MLFVSSDVYVPAYAVDFDVNSSFFVFGAQSLQMFVAGDCNPSYLLTNQWSAIAVLYSFSPSINL